MRREPSGQVLVEYLLMLALCVAFILAIQASFRQSVYAVWVTLAKQISAGCPNSGCLPPPQIK